MSTESGVDPREELRSAMESGNPRVIAHTAMTHIWELFDTAYRELTAAVESIPSSLLEHHPVLWVLHRVNPLLAHRRTPFKPYIKPDSMRSMSTDEIDMLTLAQMVAFRYGGDVTSALAYAGRLAERIKAKGTAYRERADGPLWFYHQQIGSTMLAAGDTGRALTELSASAQIGEITGREDVRRLAISRIALAHAKRGSLDDAEQLLAQLPALAEETSPYSEPSRSAECTAAALIGVERMVDDVDELLTRLDPFDSLQLTWPFALLARTRSLTARHRPDEALEAVTLARDSHPEQQGSLAVDVINAASTDALWALGAKSQARAIAYRTERRGFLETSSAIRLAIADDELDFADTNLRRLTERPDLSPSQHNERTVLTAWLSWARAERIDAATGERLSHIVRRGFSRRILSQVPREVLAAAKVGLDSSQHAIFDASSEGIAHVSVQSRPTLTNGELRVLGALRRNLTTAQIAAQLHVSPNTIKTQLGSIYRKLACSNRAEAVQTAVGLQLLANEFSTP